MEYNERTNKQTKTKIGVSVACEYLFGFYQLACIVGIMLYITTSCFKNACACGTASLVTSKVVRCSTRVVNGLVDKLLIQFIAVGRHALQLNRRECWACECLVF